MDLLYLPICFALTHEEQKRSAFAYQYSVFQLERSRNLLFLRGTTMNEVYHYVPGHVRALAVPAQQRADGEAMPLISPAEL